MVMWQFYGTQGYGADSLPDQNLVSPAGAEWSLQILAVASCRHDWWLPGAASPAPAPHRTNATVLWKWGWKPCEPLSGKAASVALLRS
jgi:hypothetical protein